MKRYTVTAALPYANGPVHIGHLAGCYLPADTYVRMLRLLKKPVLFICGSDEHGVPITLKARDEGTSPQAVVDKYHALMGDAFKNFGISFDVYDRTSNPIHHKTAQDFFLNLYEKGMLVEQTSEQFYDPEAGQFLADRYIVGTCPSCGNENAYGDQCEKCGKSLSPEELIEPRSKLSGAAPVKKPTKHWYLPLDKFQKQWLEQWIQTHAEDWRPTVYGQCRSWLEQGLQPRAVTRDLEWGVPVPLEGAHGKVLYVWFDAPIGYISATKTWAATTGGNWKDWWQSSDAQLVHFIGKDNIVFHCLIFPAMLKAHGDFILPSYVPANEFLNLEGDKISTSRQWAVWLHEYLQDFPQRQDELRYVLTGIAPETKDSDFSWKDFQARVNNELADILGNFVNRIWVLMHKYHGGQIPDVAYTPDEELETTLHQAYTGIPEHIEKFQFRQALQLAMQLARQGNKFLAESEPWKLKDASQELQRAAILNYGIEICRRLSIVLSPFLPNTSLRLRRMLQLSESFTWQHLITEHLAAGHRVGLPEILFQKMEDTQIQAQIDKLHQSKAAQQASPDFPKPVKEEIEFETFGKMDLRTGLVVEAEKVPKADKLLQLKVEIGHEVRTIVSGIAEHFTPEQILRKRVLVLANLKPRKIRGIESQGMLLFAENADGSLHLVSPADSAQSGSTVQ